MKKWVQYFPTHYLFWRQNILPVLYNKCIPQVNRTPNMLNAILSKNLLHQNLLELHTVHPQLWQLKMKITEPVILRKSVRLKIYQLNNPAAFLRIFFCVCLYILNNKLFAESVYSKIYLKKPTKIKAQYLTFLCDAKITLLHYTYNKNRRGLRTDPWATPQFIAARPKSKPFMDTYWFRLDK